MPSIPLAGYATKPDLGKLKTEASAFSGLWNIRGRGGLGARRNGIKTLDSFTVGIMGIFDVKVEGDPTTPDKIVVIGQGGDWRIYDPTELL